MVSSTSQNQQKKPGRLFLVDGTALCYRAFYAVRDLVSSRGQPTNAVFGVVTMLKKLMEEERPDALAFAFDLPEPTFRHARYEGYKAHRAPMPDPLVEQIPMIKEVIQAYRIPIFEKAGFEADDILGTLATQAAQEGWMVYLVTSDKDAYQLLGDNVKIYRTTREGSELFDEKALKDRWNLKPDQVVEVMALMGDAVDAVPGVPGIGEKTAVSLIQQFGSVENLLKKIEEVPGTARREAIQKNNKQLKMSRELVILNTQIPLKIDWDQIKSQEADWDQLRSIFQALEFKRLLEGLPAAEGAKSSSVSVGPVASGADWKKALIQIRKGGCVAVALEAPRENLVDAKLEAIGLSWKKGQAYFWTGSSSMKGLKELWADSKVTKIFTDLKLATALIQREGLDLAGPVQEPSLASYLTDPSGRSHKIADLSLEFLNTLISDGEDPQRSAAFQAEAAFKLMPILKKELRTKSLEKLYQNVELPLTGLLAQMELRGVALDQKMLQSLSKELERTLESLTKKIIKLAGEEFNVNSPKQLAQILFEKLKLPVIKRTKTGPSTNEEVLVRLSSKHPLPVFILEYRELAKLRSTYLEALPKLVSASTGRIHASFNQTVTATGRLSSSNPNLQNIPIRTELGRQVRAAFVPSQADAQLLAADYSQIELRILAHLSEDRALIQAFRDGADVHRSTAAEIFNVKPEKVSDEQRSAAKTINFGIVYGMSAFGLSKELDIAQPEAQEFIDQYFDRYPGVADYLEGSRKAAKRQGYCTTLFHRRRYIPELKSKNAALRQFAERTSINAPIQGSAADLIKVAMVALDQALLAQKLSAQLLIQVHDELVFQVLQKELKETQVLVKEVMESPAFDGKPIQLKVPILVNLTVGSNWLEASHG